MLIVLISATQKTFTSSVWSFLALTLTLRISITELEEMQVLLLLERMIHVS